MSRISQRAPIERQVSEATPEWTLPKSPINGGPSAPVRAEPPRERLLNEGGGKLSDGELLALLFAPGRHPDRGEALAERALGSRGIARLAALSPRDLRRQAGIGPVKAARLLACFEIGRRLHGAGEDASPIRGPEDVYQAVPDIRQAKKEHFMAFHLNARNQVIARDTVSIGSLNASIVHPREVYEPAVRNSAAALILVHNHPSGDTDPSDDDLALTRRLVQVGELLGISVLDHIIVGKRGFTSLKQQGFL